MQTKSEPKSVRWTGFWKGTPLHFDGWGPTEGPLTRKWIKQMTSPGGSFLRQLDGLYAEGLTKKDIIELLTQQLDDIEAKLRQAERDGIIVPDKTPQAASLQKIFDKEAHTTLMLWFANIACLLHMKAIQDDDMNGWLVKEVHDMPGGPWAVCYPAGLCVDGEDVSVFAPKRS